MQILTKLSKSHIILIFIFSAFFLSFSSNPPKGKTGAPGDSFCTECHNPSSSTIEGTLDITGLPDLVNPGEIYNLTLTNSITAGTPTRSGFQMVVLDPSNANSGNLTNNESGTTVANVGGRTYWDHSPAKFFQSETSVSWTIDWEAPDAPLGDSISFYAAGILGNGTNSSGDKALRTVKKVRLDLASSVDQDDFASQFFLYPNPADDFINIETSLLNFEYNLFDGMGKNIAQGKNDNRIETSEINSGVYYLLISSSNKRITQKVLISH